jgi:thiamine kinase
MVTALSRPIQLKLEQTLAQWRQWQCAKPLQALPEIDRILGEGHSNYSILVTAGEQYVVRIDGVQPLTHGLNRQGEWHTLQAAHKAGLAPRPCYFNLDLGSLVCEYLRPDEQAEPSIDDIAALLRRIHALPPGHSRLDLRGRIARYEKQLPTGVAGEIESYRETVLHCLARRAKDRSRLVRCHNDLLRANRLNSGGRLWAIDWEYSAMADPWHELAVIICGDDLSTTQTHELLVAYLDRTPTLEEAHALRDYCVIYRYLELLWYGVQDHPAMTPERQRLAVQRLADSVAQARA